MFHLQSSPIYRAVKLERRFIFKLVFLLRNLFFLIFFLILLNYFWSIYQAQDLFLKFGLISLALAFLFFEFSFFFELKIKNPKIKISFSEAINDPNFNLAFFLNFEAAKILSILLKQRKKKKFQKFPFFEHLLFLLCDSNLEEINFIFNRAELSSLIIKKELKEFFKEIKKDEIKKDLEKLISIAVQISFRRKKERIGIEDLFLALIELSSFFQEYLILANLKKEDFENLIEWYGKIKQRISQEKRFWEYENLLKKGSIAKDWAAGYSIVLDRYAFDLREVISKTGFIQIVGHQEEINQMKKILEKEEINNVLLVGESGSGRKSIIKAVAQEAYLGKGSSKINYKRVLDFDIGQLITETTSVDELEILLEKCFQECVRAGNIILVIEEIHNFLHEESSPGAIDISNILARYLSFPGFQLIASTTHFGFNYIFQKKPSILNLFEKVNVSEISPNETLELLELSLGTFERKYKKFVTYKALREILRLTSRYFGDIPFPEKAIRLLDECLSWLVISKKGNILKTKHVREVVSEKIKIPLMDLEKKEKEVLLNLESLLHQRIIDQEEAVKYVSQALRRVKANIELKSGPIGSFLFLGPTGVGKTETAKALAALYFGSEKKMIRLDMSEFQEIEDIGRLIGKEGEGGYLTIPVRENPFSLLLLDELEKAHPNILNLFLQVLDEGWITDGWGRKVDFKNIIIISTSNAGAEFIRQNILKNKEMNFKDDLINYLLKEKIFRPEFINRFDAVVIFKPLTKEHLFAICELMFKKLAENLYDKGIIFKTTPELKKEIVELSYSPEFGARQMRRVIQDKIESLLTEAILSDKLKRGKKVKVEIQPFRLKIN